ncbi:molybdate transport system substrate-binding protein [Microbacterium sp. W4I4]|uniref:molybdate ABC transporter substrate-binding protein n=1 Tax=Microbacterium sp. W4I4 TaxID=3042295 RepID=UPI00277E8976|nr:molybdate ABC transporter substrate-binding protein [Microbacterium sp. W4I4]MDQ0615657.1 molybdate transport system substrate-binding protein [Microbacterium sp. W4I4]
MRRLPAIAAVAALALLLGGCTTAQPRPSADSDAISGDLAVSAAASLQGAFDAAITEFTTAHPEVHVVVNYDGSSTLATQIDNGARVDVFASADQANMARVTDAGLAAAPAIFAGNTLVVVVPRGSSADVRTLADLAKPGVKTVLCAPEVPCGAASKRLLDNAGIDVTPVSQEQNVTAVLTKVRGDEADAGLVYRTDAETADVESFAPEGADRVVNSYPIAVLADAPNPTAANAFVAFIRGDAGQRVLASLGFEAP